MNSISKTFDNILSYNYSKSKSHCVCSITFGALLIILIITGIMFVLLLLDSIFADGSFPHIISREEVNIKTKEIDEWCQNLKSVPTHICERFITLNDAVYCSVPCEYTRDHFSELSCERDCKKLFKSKNSYLAIHTFQIDLLYIFGISFSLGMGIFIYYYSYE